MNNKTLLAIIILAIFTIIIHVSPSQAQICNAAQPSTCGVSISTTGHGAVELCANCFVCGAEDGVCPAWYSTGNKTIGEVPTLLRKGEQDRPNVTDAFTIAYETANEACGNFGGTFVRAQTKNTALGSWSNDLSISGNDSMTLRDDYVQAICENVSKTASCDACIDVDCTNTITGVAYASAPAGSTHIEGAIITILPAEYYDDSLLRQAVSSAEGTYSFQAYSGNVRVTCAAEGYESTITDITLKPGTNIVDCNLGHATCAADCTIPSSQYGVRICAKECDGINGCSYLNESIMNACDRRPKGFFYQTHQEINLTQGLVILTGYDCCISPGERSYPLFNLAENNNITNLITRSYNKILPDGTPVFLNLIIYNKK